MDDKTKAKLAAEYVNKTKERLKDNYDASSFLAVLRNEVSDSVLYVAATEIISEALSARETEPETKRPVIYLNENETILIISATGKIVLNVDPDKHFSSLVVQAVRGDS